MGMVSAAWYLGATVAAVVGYGLYGVEDGWKWMLGSAVVPCVVLLVGRHDIPESPLWLASKGRHAEARAVMDRVFGPDVELAPVKPTDKTPLATLLHGEYLKRMIFLGVFILCQVVPMYAIYTFKFRGIMTALGLGEGHEAILGESAVSLFFLVGSIPAMFWLNSMGGGAPCCIELAQPAHGGGSARARGVQAHGAGDGGDDSRIRALRRVSVAARASCSGCTPTSSFPPRCARRPSASPSASARVGTHRGHLRDASRLRCLGRGARWMLVAGAGRGSCCSGSFCRTSWRPRPGAKPLAETSGVDDR